MQTPGYVTAGLAAMDANMAAFFGAYGRADGCSHLDHAGNVLFYTGIPNAMMNGAIISRDDRGDILAFEARLSAEIARARAPATWWIGSAAHTPSIEHRLAAFGLEERGSVPAMAADIPSLPRSPEVKGLYVDEAGDPRARVAWTRLAAEAMGFSQAAAEAWAEVEARLDPADAPGVRRFTGFLAGKPVGTAAIVTTGTVAGLYAVATLPEARGHGVATAVALQALDAATGSGARTAVVQATGAGLPLLERIGFVSLFDYLIYRQS